MKSLKERVALVLTPYVVNDVMADILADTIDGMARDYYGMLGERLDWPTNVEEDHT